MKTIELLITARETLIINSVLNLILLVVLLILLVKSFKGFDELITQQTSSQFFSSTFSKVENALTLVMICGSCIGYLVLIDLIQNIFLIIALFNF